MSFLSDRAAREFGTNLSRAPVMQQYAWLPSTPDVLEPQMWARDARFQRPVPLTDSDSNALRLLWS